MVVIDNQTVGLNITLITKTTTGIIHGYVKNASSGKPISSAYVSFSEGNTYTNFEGYYRFEGVINTTHTFTGYAKGFITGIKPVKGEAGIEMELDFDLVPIEGLVASPDCGNNLVDSANREECDLGVSLNGAAGSGCTENCRFERCGTDTITGTGKCVLFDYQCRDINNQEALGTYYTNLDWTCKRGDSGIGLPDQKCCNGVATDIPECINGAATLLNKQIGETDVSDSRGTMCYCKSEGIRHSDYWDTSPSSGESRLYCCNRIISTIPCLGNNGLLKGYVYDAKTNGLLNGIEIMARLPDQRLVAKTVTYRDAGRFPADEDGGYNISLPRGNYLITASSADYEEMTVNLTVDSGSVTIQDFRLEPKITDCSKPDTFPQPRLNVVNIIGSPVFNIGWSHPCPAGSIAEFRLYRDNILVQVFPNSIYSYDDISGLEWGNDYLYNLSAVSTSGVTNTTSVAVTTGDDICDGSMNDKFSFCVNSGNEIEPVFTKRVHCTNENRFVIDEDCSVKFPSGFCILPSPGATECARRENCETLGISPYPTIELPNILGLYYDRRYYGGSLNCTFNLSDNKRRFCYYDYSATTIDKCFNCKTDGNCFDYNSESACLSDNCLYGQTRKTQCKWFSTSYGELGKGVCYPEGYTGTDKCNLCDSRNQLFGNLYCLNGLCSRLGDCYSNPAENSCQQCDSGTVTRCEDYIDEETCTGGKNFEIPGGCGSATVFLPSRDACNRGKCRWKGNECLKDANNDNSPDCADSADTPCQTD
ncbi:carboxypeptidase regulatory-like domain-containing protein, partial [Candidatus Pacearchaeota archaeon]|nr:carboxypeptidase regulatory-like domain-containing protein [Candidatus Pacearchaeota archaeon]